MAVGTNSKAASNGFFGFYPFLTVTARLAGSVSFDLFLWQNSPVITQGEQNPLLQRITWPLGGIWTATLVFLFSCWKLPFNLSHLHINLYKNTHAVARLTVIQTILMFPNSLHTYFLMWLCQPPWNQRQLTARIRSSKLETFSSFLRWIFYFFNIFGFNMQGQIPSWEKHW